MRGDRRSRDDGLQNRTAPSVNSSAGLAPWPRSRPRSAQQRPGATSTPRHVPWLVERLRMLPVRGVNRRLVSRMHVRTTRMAQSFKVMLPLTAGAVGGVVRTRVARGRCRAAKPLNWGRRCVLPFMLLAVLVLPLTLTSHAAHQRMPPGILTDLGLTRQQIAAVDAGRPVVCVRRGTCEGFARVISHGRA
jgi:hypothetical protein